MLKLLFIEDATMSLAEATPLRCLEIVYGRQIEIEALSDCTANNGSDHTRLGEALLRPRSVQLRAVQPNGSLIVRKLCTARPIVITLQHHEYSPVEHVTM